MAITAQEAWTERAGALQVEIPDYVREVVEEVAFQARADRKIDKRSGVSQRLPISLLENVVSNAERRALLATARPSVVPRVTDIYAALPAITGKFELEYEGELRGADNVARDLIRAAVGNVFTGYFANADTAPGDRMVRPRRQRCRSTTRSSAAELLSRTARGAGPARADAARRRRTRRSRRRCSRRPSTSCSKGCTRRRRSAARDERQLPGAPSRRRAAPRAATIDRSTERDMPLTGDKKKYYN